MLTLFYNENTCIAAPHSHFFQHINHAVTLISLWAFQSSRSLTSLIHFNQHSLWAVTFFTFPAYFYSPFQTSLTSSSSISRAVTSICTLIIISHCCFRLFIIVTFVSTIMNYLHCFICHYPSFPPPTSTSFFSHHLPFHYFFTVLFLFAQEW